MSKNKVIKKNFNKLKTFTRGMKQKYVSRVGIIGSGNDNREDSVMGNAEIGIVQEFGSATKNIKSRSFLRMPIESKSKQIVKDVVKKKDLIEKSLADGNIKFLYSLLAVAAEKQVLTAFDTSGFGTWEAIKPRKDGSSTPLRDTDQLMRSITSDVERSHG